MRSPIDTEPPLFSLDYMRSMAENGLTVMRRRWKDEKKLTPLAISWPERPVKSSDGSMINHPCIMELTHESNWNEALCAFVKLTDACGLLLIEEQPTRLRALLETPDGTLCWSIPKKDHGDVVILGKTSLAQDKESIGILWRPKKGVS